MFKMQSVLLLFVILSWQVDASIQGRRVKNSLNSPDERRIQGPWGDCDDGTFIIGMELEHNDLDMTSTVHLFCGSGNGTTQFISNLKKERYIAHKNTNTKSQFCTSFAIGFGRESESGIELHCKQEERETEDDEFSQTCPVGQAICGFRSEGKWLKSGPIFSSDQRGLKNLGIKCCHLKVTCTPEIKWNVILDEVGTARMKTVYNMRIGSDGENLSPETITEEDLPRKIILLLKDEIKHTSGITEEASLQNWETALYTKWMNESVQNMEVTIPSEKRLQVFQLTGLCGSFVINTDVTRTCFTSTKTFSWTSLNWKNEKVKLILAILLAFTIFVAIGTLTWFCFRKSDSRKISTNELEFDKVRYFKCQQCSHDILHNIGSGNDCNLVVAEEKC